MSEYGRKKTGKPPGEANKKENDVGGRSKSDQTITLDGDGKGRVRIRTTVGYNSVRVLNQVSGLMGGIRPTWGGKQKHICTVKTRETLNPEGITSKRWEQVGQLTTG